MLRRAFVPLALLSALAASHIQAGRACAAQTPARTAELRRDVNAASEPSRIAATPVEYRGRRTYAGYPLYPPFYHRYAYGMYYRPWYYAPYAYAFPYAYGYAYRVPYVPYGVYAPYFTPYLGGPVYPWRNCEPDAPAAEDDDPARRSHYAGCYHW